MYVSPFLLLKILKIQQQNFSPFPSLIFSFPRLTEGNLSVKSKGFCEDFDPRFGGFARSAVDIVEAKKML